MFNPVISRTSDLFGIDSMGMQTAGNCIAYFATALKIAQLNPLAAGLAMNVGDKTAKLVSRFLVQLGVSKASPNVKVLSVIAGGLAGVATYAAVASLTYKVQLACYVGLLCLDIGKFIYDITREIKARQQQENYYHSQISQQFHF